MNEQNILETEFSDKFVKMMQNRMIVSYFKYGRIADAYPHKVDALQSMTERVKLYLETGNTEYLIDAANFLMIEFMHPKHPKATFKAEDSDKSPGRVTIDGEITMKENREL